MRLYVFILAICLANTPAARGAALSEDWVDGAEVTTFGGVKDIDVRF
jgi:hypothetical protein